MSDIVEWLRVMEEGYRVRESRFWKEEEGAAADFKRAADEIIRLRAIVAGIHRAIGESEDSDDDSLPEIIESIILTYRTYNAELERTLSKSIMHQKELDRCVHLSEEMIDNAWEFNEDSNAMTKAHGRAMLYSCFCITSCDKCDGTREVLGWTDCEDLVSCPACYRNGKSHGWWMWMSPQKGGRDE